MRHHYSKQLNTFYDKFFTEIFGHDGTSKYMNQNLDMKGKSISNAIQLSSITYVYTPAWRAMHIEFSDVASGKATDLLIKSGSTIFMSFNVSIGMSLKQ